MHACVRACVGDGRAWLGVSGFNTILDSKAFIGFHFDLVHSVGILEVQNACCGQLDAPNR